MTALMGLGAAVVLMVVGVRSGRPRRGGTVLHARKLSFLRRYHDRSLVATVVLGAIALGTVPLFDGSPAPLNAALLALACALLWRFGLAAAAQWAVALLCLFATAIALVTLPLTLDAFGPGGRLLAIGTFVILVAAYGLGAVLGGLLVGFSAQSVLTTFAVVDVVAFLVSPFGLALAELEPVRLIVHVAIAVTACFALGLLSIDFIAVLAAVAVTVAGFVGGTEASASRMAAVAMAAVVAVLAGPGVSDRADR